LARQEEKYPKKIQEIAKARNIPRKFLESILLALKNNGFLGSKKGKGGGYYLLRPANEIPLTSVMRVLEGPIAMISCVSLNYYEACDDCPDEATCSVHRLMIQVRDSALYVYRNNSLADII